MAKKDAKPADFEAMLEELEKLVETMEGGELSLEDSLKRFERGVVLSRNCQAALRNAQQQVDRLLGADENARPEPFEPGD